MNEPPALFQRLSSTTILAAFRNTNNQMAICLMAIWWVAGLVTFEDLLEEIVGEIDDETDKSSIRVREIGENTPILLGCYDS